MFNGVSILLTTIIGIRIKDEDKKLLKTVCEARGEDVSGFVRRAIRKELAGLSFYSAETKKALGVKEEQSP